MTLIVEMEAPKTGLKERPSRLKPDNQIDQVSIDRWWTVNGFGSLLNLWWEIHSEASFFPIVVIVTDALGGNESKAEA